MKGEVLWKQRCYESRGISRLACRAYNSPRIHTRHHIHASIYIHSNIYMYIRALTSGNVFVCVCVCLLQVCVCVWRWENPPSPYYLNTGHHCKVPRAGTWKQELATMTNIMARRWDSLQKLTIICEENDFSWKEKVLKTCQIRHGLLPLGCITLLPLQRRNW